MTRDRLISAAGPVFARQGYDGATVTQICAAAGANVAAINYHFGDKRSLYREAIRTAIQRVKQDKAEPAGGGPDPVPIEARLAAMTAKILRGVRALDDSNWPLALVLREFLQPTAEFGYLVRAEIDVLSPSSFLCRTVAAATGLAVDDPRLQWSIFCVLAPTLLLASKPVEMARQFPALDPRTLDLEAFAAHVGRTLANGLARSGAGTTRPVRRGAAKAKRA